MINAKQWKLIPFGIIFLVIPSVLYMNSRKEPTEKARISNNNILPSSTKIYSDTGGELLRQQQENQDHANRELYNQEDSKEGVETGQEYDIVKQVNFALARISSLGDSNEMSEDKHNQRGTDVHDITHKIQPNSDPTNLLHIPDDVINMAPNVFNKVPRQFLPEYKSPCWLDKQDELYCLPYFYIIGMAKCGTTELWDKITQHPDVVASVPKEPHWWARRRHGFTGASPHGKKVHQIRQMTGKKDDSSFDWYLNWCKTFGVKSVESNPSQNADGDVAYPQVFGDASVSTSFDIWGSWGSEEGNYTNADLIHAVQPQAKIIMIVRDPTERFFSAFNFNGKSRDKSLVKFDKVAKDATQCFTQCLQKHSERFCLFTQQCDIVRDIYIAYAKDWIRLYGHDGVYILRLEDWMQNTADEFKKVLQFLDLPALSDDMIVQITNRKAKNVNGQKAKRPTMWDTTRKDLQDFFRPYNRRLADLMNDTRFAYEG